MDTKKVDVMVADASHEIYVDKILDTIREAAKVRGTGIAERTHEYVATKMKEKPSSPYVETCLQVSATSKAGETNNTSLLPV